MPRAIRRWIGPAWSFVAAISLGFGAAADDGLVDDRRLLAAGDRDDRNWLTFGQDYRNQRFSSLDQISRATVARLKPAWIYQTGAFGSFSTTPLVVDGVMYITLPGNDVAALDAGSGAELWRYRHELRAEPFGAPGNRGAAIGYGKVYEATDDGRLIALDQKSGAVIWDVVIATPDQGAVEELAMLGPDFGEVLVSGTSRLGAKMPPLVHDGKVIVGVTGAGYGLHFESAPGGGDVGVAGIEGHFGKRGYLAAYDAQTGRELWRWYTTKADGWEGEFRRATADGVPLNRDIAAEKALAGRYRDAWRSGGGSTWMTPALDPGRGLLYLGTGNPAPQNYGYSRPGDNLYTSGVAALEVATGALRWFFQQVPHDLWGYDAASQTVLFDASIDGRAVPAVGQAGKTGWFYVNDRTSGELLFKSEPFVPQVNLFAPPTRGRGDGGARRRRRRLLVAGVVRPEHRRGLCRRDPRAVALFGRHLARGGRSGAGPLHAVGGVRRRRGGRLRHADRARHARSRADPVAGQDRADPGRRRAGHRRRPGLHGRGQRRSQRVRRRDRRAALALPDRRRGQRAPDLLRRRRSPVRRRGERRQPSVRLPAGRRADRLRAARIGGCERGRARRGAWRRRRMWSAPATPRARSSPMCAT